MTRCSKPWIAARGGIATHPDLMAQWIEGHIPPTNANRLQHRRHEWLPVARRLWAWQNERLAFQAFRIALVELRKCEYAGGVDRIRDARTAFVEAGQDLYDALRHIAELGDTPPRFQADAIGVLQQAGIDLTELGVEPMEG